MLCVLKFWIQKTQMYSTLLNISKHFILSRIPIMETNKYGYGSICPVKSLRFSIIFFFLWTIFFRAVIPGARVGYLAEQRHHFQAEIRVLHRHCRLAPWCVGHCPYKWPSRTRPPGCLSDPPPEMKWNSKQTWYLLDAVLYFTYSINNYAHIFNTM